MEEQANNNNHFFQENPLLPPQNQQQPRQRKMFDYARPLLIDTESNIVRPPVATNKFEIKSNIIHIVQQHVQFDGLLDEDPNAHITNFLET